jgi:hypothetical protein
MPSQAIPHASHAIPPTCITCHTTCITCHTTHMPYHMHQMPYHMPWDSSLRHAILQVRTHIDRHAVAIGFELGPLRILLLLHAAIPLLHQSGTCPAVSRPLHASMTSPLPAACCRHCSGPQQRPSPCAVPSARRLMWMAASRTERQRRCSGAEAGWWCCRGGSLRSSKGCKGRFPHTQVAAAWWLQQVGHVQDGVEREGAESLQCAAKLEAAEGM